MPVRRVAFRRTSSGKTHDDAAKGRRRKRVGELGKGPLSDAVASLSS